MVLGEGSTRAQASSHTALGERGSEQELQGEEKLARRVCSEQRPRDWRSVIMGEDEDGKVQVNQPGSQRLSEGHRL